MRLLQFKTWVVGIFAVGVMAIAPVWADGARIAMVGQGQVVAVPDMATIRLGVVAQDTTAAGALAAASVQMNRLLATVAEQGVAERDVQTSQLNVQPVYRDAIDRNAPPQIVAYEAQSDVSVRVRNLAGLGDMLDGVALSGGNRFSGLTFDVQDRAPLLAQARVAAVQDAMTKAALYADAAGVELGPIIEMAEDGASPSPMMMESAVMRSMPIAMGEIEITARLRMVFSLNN